MTEQGEKRAQVCLALATMMLAAGLCVAYYRVIAVPPTRDVEGELPGPTPGLGPGEVVQLILSSLRRNDEWGRDAGILATFNFASPANRRQTGPFERFARMVKSQTYRPLMEFATASYGPVEVAGDHASQTVTLYSRTKQAAVYTFYLSRQAAAPYIDCWMTDAVVRQPVTTPGAAGQEQI